MLATSRENAENSGAKLGSVDGRDMHGASANGPRWLKSWQSSERQFHISTRSTIWYQKGQLRNASTNMFLRDGHRFLRDVPSSPGDIETLLFMKISDNMRRHLDALIAIQTMAYGLWIKVKVRALCVSCHGLRRER